jgi:hypothetical protein
MFSKIRSLCSPETFTALQKIFDGGWAEIETSRVLAAEEIEEARSELATLVIAQKDRTDLAETAKLRKEVLETFWRNRRQQNSR